MLQLVITYEKATLKVISAIQINTLITDANILKTPGYEALITLENNALRLGEQGQMYLKSELIK